MPVRLLPWAPEHGTSMQFDTESEGDANGGSARVDTTVEGPWEPVSPRAVAPAAVQIVDGVRRVEAHALDDDPAGGPMAGLFGSLAVGVVRCDAAGASILDGPYAPRVERHYLQAGGVTPPVASLDRDIEAGTTLLRFRGRVPAQATTSNDLVASLNRLMLDEEAKLAEELSRDETVLTLVDGPLRLRSPGPRVVGYVKRTHRWYVDAGKQQLLPLLGVGERTPLFRIDAQPDGAAPGGRGDRLGWFLRIADMGPHFHTLSGVVRLEVPGELPLGEAVRLADQAAVTLPRFASSPVRDPRAPQNLTPVGALEALLTRRLGDRLQIRRWISRALADDSALRPGTPMRAATVAVAGAALW